MEEIPEGKIKPAKISFHEIYEGKYVDCIIMSNKKQPSSKKSYQVKKEVLEKAVISEAAGFGLSFFKNFWEKIFSAFGEFKLTFGSVFKLLLASKITLILVLITLVVPLTAFEAHVVNVTATIERRPSQCAALSPGYWANHDGCSQGYGKTKWMNQIHDLSNSYSGVFGSLMGELMCKNLWEASCPLGNNIPAKLCRAKRHVLALELNIVSARLDPNAIIAGSDDGSSSFDNFGLSPASTVKQALTVLESTLANPSSTIFQLNDTAYVAERINTFYESENPSRPECVYTWGNNDFVSTSASEEDSSDGDGKKTLGDGSGDESLFGASVLQSFGLSEEANSTSTENSTSSTDVTTSTATSTSETGGSGEATTTISGISPDSTSTAPVVDPTPTSTSTEPVSPPADTTPPADPTPPPPADTTPPPTDPTPPPVSDTSTPPPADETPPPVS